jgi:4-azaleucine resistance transporter AzlC
MAEKALADREALRVDVAASLARGARDSISILIGVFPVGIAFGIAAREHGFSLFEASLMSLIVFAGASQFIGIAMIASGAAIVEVAITTFFVNLRHLVMAASLSAYLRDAGKGFLSLLAFQLTDESFGLSVTRFARGEADRWYLLAVNLAMYSCWNVATLAGHLMGELLPEIVRSAMAFALYGVFIALLVLACRRRIAVVVALFSAALSVALYQGNVSTGNIIVVCLAGATLGLGLELWKER